jgi:hypothetical protein
LKVEDYHDDAEMPGSRLNIGFHGNRGAQVFRGGGVSEGDRRAMRCDIIRRMDWDRLVEYLGDVWEEVWDAMLFKLKVAEMSMS